MLSETLLRNCKPKGKPYKLPRESGLSAIVNPNGTKWWRFTYSFEGKEKTISLGTYPLIPLSLARQRRDAARRLVAEGVDPSARRREKRDLRGVAIIDTFSAIVDRWEIDEMVNNSDSYRATIRKMLDRDVLPFIGQRQIKEIKTRDLIIVIDRIRQRGVEDTARRARTIIGQVFKYAIRRGFAEYDPTHALKGERRIIRVKHYAAFTEPSDVSRLMRAIYAYKGSYEVRAALKLSAMLFQRPGEIRQMQWTQLDLDAMQWRYVVNKTKRKTGASHIVPLPSQAVALLRDMYPLTGNGLGLKPEAPRYVLPTPKTRLRPLSENAVRQALRNMGFTNDEMTAHGFRAMARSLLAELGWKPDAIERQLSHKAAGPLGAAYDRAAFMVERKAMMQAWADYLDALREDRGPETLNSVRSIEVISATDRVRDPENGKDEVAERPPGDSSRSVQSPINVPEQIAEIKRESFPPRETYSDSPAQHLQNPSQAFLDRFRQSMSFRSAGPQPIERRSTKNQALDRVNSPQVPTDRQDNLTQEPETSFQKYIREVLSRPFPRNRY